MPRSPKACKRCGAEPGQHKSACRYAKGTVSAAPPSVAPSRIALTAKIRKRVFTIDHPDGTETTIAVTGPAGAVKCNSTEQSVQVWAGEQPAAAPPSQFRAPTPRPLSNDVAYSGQEYTTTDALDDVPGGNLGLSDEEASDPDAVLRSLERKRLSMIGRMSGESPSSGDVLLIPEGAN